ncbi:hypothetical protein Pan216_53940 [Planctomycetes bacterium Pan216]|uniref:Uncharacterized protein n=1 Tax=Kolteria novifilia TaxID=2527975 RepID=A0A518BBZ2_9BACT|nr:hypothetical protein Pan216_53940 [Planctomycetes bacterium Pan216]
MAGKKTGGPNKSAFARDFLKKKPDASVKDVQAAWNTDGNKDELNPTLVYQMKSKLGLARGRGRRKKKKASAKASPVSATPAVARRGRPLGDDRAGSYEAIETQLDRLVAEAEALGDRSLASELRSARRYCSAKLI